MLDPDNLTLGFVLEAGHHYGCEVGVDDQAGGLAFGGAGHHLLGRGVSGKPNGEGSPCQTGVARVVALGPDLATVLMDDAAADGQTESGATLLARIGGLDLVETAE